MLRALGAHLVSTST